MQAYSEMGDIKKLLFSEMEKRYAALSEGQGNKPALNMQEAADLLGDKELLNALMNNRHIKRCKNCGKLFATKSKRERYCNRPFEGGKTCKEVGSANARSEDPVTKIMDAARRLHLYRRKASGKDKEAQRKYEEWLDFALIQEKRCRAGEISEDKLKELIGRSYAPDRTKGKSRWHKEEH